MTARLIASSGCSLALLLASFGSMHTQPALASGGEACQKAAEANTIELAIALDTSGSMNGLIDAARAKLWDIVSDLATATPRPALRVAIIQFGNDSLAQENGWTSVEADLTDDLDLVSQKLFALTTNGGTEYVGRAVDKATKGLSWSTGSALRIVVVAGNESADQDGEVRYNDACKRAIEKGILVNSIYCGAVTDSLAPAWKDVAMLADGHFACIDQNNGTVIVETPFDAELVTLSTAINDTYVPYGSRGEAAWNNQSVQDRNASQQSSSIAAQRSVTKGCDLYQNRGWDLVDACKDAEFKLDGVTADALPEAMRDMSLAERKAYVEGKAKAREEIQVKINALGVKRQQYVAEETAKRAQGDTAAFDRAIRDAIRAQAGARGFNFPEAPAAPAATAAPVSAASAR